MTRSYSVLLFALLLLADGNAFQMSPHRPHLATQRYVSLSTPSTASYATSSDSSQSVSWDWKQVATDVFEEDERPIILFDGLCNLCHAGVNFAFDNDPDGESFIDPLPSLVPTAV